MKKNLWKHHRRDQYHKFLVVRDIILHLRFYQSILPLFDQIDPIFDPDNPRWSPSGRFNNSKVDEKSQNGFYLSHKVDRKCLHTDSARPDRVCQPNLPFCAQISLKMGLNCPYLGIIKLRFDIFWLDKYVCTSFNLF